MKKKAWLILLLVMLPVVSFSEEKPLIEIQAFLRLMSGWADKNPEEWNDLLAEMENAANDINDEEEKAWKEILLNLNESSFWMDYEFMDTPNQWFLPIELPGDVIAIVEWAHEQLAISFLISGSERALLLDTCTGFQNLREVVDQLTTLPVTVLNSHDHFDHFGGNSAFDEVWCYNLPSAVALLTNGPTEDELREILGVEKKFSPLVWTMGLNVPETIPGKAPTGTVEDGQIISLGGRELEVIHTPGHQPSCIMLLDSENQLLFTGDMFYPGQMYCMFEDSSFEDYVLSIRKAADLTVNAGIQAVYTSHNEPVTDAQVLCDFADFLERVRDGEINYEVENEFRVYYFTDLISIILPGV